IGPGRVMGTIVEVRHDSEGIVWPESVAPFRVHLIQVRSEKVKVKSFGEKLYKDLQTKEVEVLYDDRDVSAGEKFADADLIGCPWRVVVSEKTVAKGSGELKKRDSKQTKLVKLNQIAKMI
ncbi:hypothetical protein HYV98_02090, partial [Candidatus Azambacteria bacterium]|nr:hypothetical protein [Candidatus Azambacteria bacterium]